MSLQAAAQHLAAQGRGSDSTLVHMSPGEVKSLQELAMAHGGSLSINPNTGLPEAGFLASILPMVAGIALGPAGLGLSAMQAGLAAGALGAMATGSLKQGLMAGLGAYGGAGFGESLAKAGMAEAGAASQAAEAAQAMPKQIYPPPGSPFTVYDYDSFISPADAALGNAQAVQPGALKVSIEDQMAKNIAGANAPLNLPPAIEDKIAADATLGQQFNGKTAPWAPSYGPVTTLAPTPISQAATGPVVDPQSMEGLNIAKTRSLSDLTPSEQIDALKQGFTGKNLMAFAKEHPWQVASMATPFFMQDDETLPTPEKDTSMGQRYTFSRNTALPFPQPNVTDYGNLGRATGVEQRYFTPTYAKVSDAEARNIFGFANGGAVERMSQANSIGANTGYPQADIRGHAYATPWQTPVPQNMVTGVADTGVNPITGEMSFAKGGMSHLGDYSDGGRLLRGPGDGVSDDIPAVIGKKQPARLADGEFVVPARIVSELGNGSTEAGARKLYAMMDRVQAGRKKTLGKGKKFAKDTKAERYLPA